MKKSLAQVLAAAAIVASLVSPTQAGVVPPRASAGDVQASPVHDIGFWREVAAHHYEVPANSSPRALSLELSKMVGSPDPEVRDEIVYSTLATWIYAKRVVDAETLRELVTQWLDNLKEDIGSQGSDAVLKRSFSALLLSVAVARDNAESYLTEAEFHRILAEALTYLRSEVDVRGYDERKGWIHSAAHTADLLKFLGRSRYLTREDQRSIMSGIREKMEAAPAVFTHGEDERYARAVLSLAMRTDLDRDAFRGWCDSLSTRPAQNERLSETSLARLQNVKNLLAKLEVVLSTQPENTAGSLAALEVLRAKLRTAF